METLQKHLQAIQDLIKKLGTGIIPSPKAPAAPAVPQPAGAPTSTKNPVKVAQQISDPTTKPLVVKQAKSMIKTDKNGQWKLEEDQ
jgi:hypothetical protein